jgi:hypothetical protein
MRTQRFRQLFKVETMRRGRIGLTHELGRFKSRTIFSLGGFTLMNSPAAAHQKPRYKSWILGIFLLGAAARVLSVGSCRGKHA